MSVHCSSKQQQPTYFYTLQWPDFLFITAAQAGEIKMNEKFQGV
jgi:hypothetical protein